MARTMSTFSGVSGIVCLAVFALDFSFDWRFWHLCQQFVTLGSAVEHIRFRRCDRRVAGLLGAVGR